MLLTKDDIKKIYRGKFDEFVTEELLKNWVLPTKDGKVDKRYTKNNFFSKSGVSPADVKKKKTIKARVVKRKITE